MPDPAQHQRVKELFLDVCQHSPDEQAAYLDATCGDDRALRAQVEDLLAAERARPEFLEDSPVPRLPPGQASAAPEQIGAFRIVRTLGEGGMGQVFEAEQDDPRRRVALKMLRPGLALPPLLARFEQEKSMLARLQHAGIAQIFDAGTAEIHGQTQPYFAMEFVDGVPLTAYVQAHDLPTPARLELFVRICDAVQHAHQKGVVHRDLKPANILVTADGQPKVLDFGVARATDSDVQLTLATDAAQIIGTLPYMSPEQASGAAEQVDARSDVYGLGVLLYELLTDRLPYDVATTPLPEAVRIICEQEPRPISAIRRGLRGDLETIAGKALEKDKARRYASANALAADVRRYLCDEPIEARPASRLYKLAKFARRNKLLVGVVSALIVALLASLWFEIRFDREAARRLASERQRYRTLIAAAASELEAGRRQPARRLLDDASPVLRDWEWRYLAAQLDESMQTLVGAEHKVWYAGFLHATGQALAVDEQSVVYLWDRSSAGAMAVRLAPQVNEELGARRPLAISDDGALVLTRATIHDSPRTSRTVAILWQAASGDVRQRFAVDNLVYDLMASAIAPTGAHVALATVARLYVYEVASARLVEALQWKYGGSTFSADGEWLAYTNGASVSFCDVASGRPARAPLAVSGGSVSELALSPDHSLLATGRLAGVEVWDVASGARRHVLRRNAAAVFQLAFSPDGAALASISDLIRIWDPATGELMYSWVSGPGRSAGGFSADSQDYVIGYRQAPAHGVRIWGLGGSSTLVLEGHQSYVYPVAINAGGSVIASGAGDGEVRLWDAATSRGIAVLGTHDTPVRGLTFDPRSPRLVSVADDVRVWDTATGAVLRCLEKPTVAAAFSPDGALLALGHGGELEVLEGRSLERRAVCETPCGVIAFTADGKGLATAAGYRGTEPGIVVWNSGSLEQAFVLPTPTAVFSLSFSPDGSLLASGERGGDVRLWDVATRRQVGVVVVRRGEVFAVQFLSGRRLASAGRDRLIRIWDVAAPVPAGDLPLVTELRGHADYVYSLALSADGEHLVSGSGDHTLRIWETQSIARRLEARRAAVSQQASAEQLARRLLADEAGVSRALERIDADAGLDPVQRREARYAVLRLTLERAKPVAGRDK